MTMNLDELRDAHAKRLGWEYCPLVFGGSWHKDGKYCMHPVPATLDAIAGLMPSGWGWRKFGGEYRAGPIVNGGGIMAGVSVPITGDDIEAEKTDRARLAWLAWEAEAKGAAQ